MKALLHQKILPLNTVWIPLFQTSSATKSPAHLSMSSLSQYHKHLYKALWYNLYRKKLKTVCISHEQPCTSSRHGVSVFLQDHFHCQSIKKEIENHPVEKLKKLRRHKR